MSGKNYFKLKINSWPLVVFRDLHNYYNEWHRATRLKNHKKGAPNTHKVQKRDTGSHELTLGVFTNSERQ